MKRIVSDFYGGIPIRRIEFHGKMRPVFGWHILNHDQPFPVSSAMMCFLDFRWKGGIAERAEITPDVLFSGKIDRHFDLVLPDGRKLEGLTEGIGALEVLENKARLDAEDPPLEKRVGSKRDYSKVKWGKREIKIAQEKIKDFRRSEKGIPDAKVVERMPEEWKKHPALNAVRCPSDSTFKGWVSQVRLLGYIRQLGG